MFHKYSLSILVLKFRYLVRKLFLTSEKLNTISVTLFLQVMIPTRMMWMTGGFNDRNTKNWM